MRRELFVFYLFLVVSLAFGANIEVNAGVVYETNIIVEKPLENTTWLGLYGIITGSPDKKPWTYFLTPFAEITNLSPTNDVREVEVNLLSSKTLAYPDYNASNWYVVVSPSSEVNLYDLNGVCDKNVDELVEGNFCDDCLPSKTYEENAYILVNDKNICARSSLLYSSVVSFLAEWNGFPVYLTPLQEFTLDGNTYNFAFLLSADGNSLYIYLTRMSILCGDGVCDPGEEGNCGDCVSLSIAVSPDYKEVNVGETAEFNVLLKNTGENDLTVSLTLVVLQGDENALTYDLSADTTTVSAGSEKTIRLVVASSKGGLYNLKIKGTVGSVDVYSNLFQLVVKTPPSEEEEEEEAGGGGGAAPPPEENAEITPTEENEIVITPRGYYIPWLGCISYLHVFSPDEVTLFLEEEKNVPVVVQNAGTCDENITFFIEGVDENFYRIPEENFFLKRRSNKTMDVTFIGYAPGVYEVYFVAKGYYESRRKMTLIVKGEKKGVSGCESKVLLLAPDVVEIVEGEEFNVVLEVSNEGSCIEDVEVKLTKEVAGAIVTIDSRSLKLPPGERFLYRPPRLASGEYTLVARAGGMEKTVSIIVRPRSVVTGVVEELILQARFAILLLLLLVVLGAVSYIRSRYLT